MQDYMQQNLYLAENIISDWKSSVLVCKVLKRISKMFCSDRTGIC